MDRRSLFQSAAADGCLALPVRRHSAPTGDRGGAGKVRHVGFTRHKDLRIHVTMMEVARVYGFQFDVVLMPSDVTDTLRC